jgi:hypothetical protein
VRDRLFEPLDAGAGRDYRDQGSRAAGQPVSMRCVVLCLVTQLHSSTAANAGSSCW